MTADVDLRRRLVADVGAGQRRGEVPSQLQLASARGVPVNLTDPTGHCAARSAEDVCEGVPVASQRLRLRQYAVGEEETFVRNIVRAAIGQARASAAFGSYANCAYKLGASAYQPSLADFGRNPDRCANGNALGASIWAQLDQQESFGTAFSHSALGGLYNDARGCFTHGDINGCVKTALNAAMFVPGVDLADIAARGALHEIEEVAAKELVSDVRAAAEGAEGAATTAARSCLNSFTADTAVTMADGSEKPISQVKFGDKVLATDPETGQTEPRPVTALIRHGGKHTMVDLTFSDGSKITATDHHPFWDGTTRTFTDAINLHVGDKVLSDDGRALTIAGEHVYDRDLTAFNLQVDGIHTYYAGVTPVLVHNSCSDEAWDIANHAFDEHGAALGFKSVDEMGSYVDSVMQGSQGILRDDGTRFWIDYSRSAIIFRGPNPGVPGTFYRPDNFLRAVEDNLARSVNEP